MWGQGVVRGQGISLGGGNLVSIWFGHSLAALVPTSLMRPQL